MLSQRMLLIPADSLSVKLRIDIDTENSTDPNSPYPYEEGAELLVCFTITNIGNTTIDKIIVSSERSGNEDTIVYLEPNNSTNIFEYNTTVTSEDVMKNNGFDTTLDFDINVFVDSENDDKPKLVTSKIITYTVGLPPS